MYSAPGPASGAGVSVSLHKEALVYDPALCEHPLRSSMKHGPRSERVQSRIAAAEGPGHSNCIQAQAKEVCTPESRSASITLERHTRNGLDTACLTAGEEARIYCALDTDVFPSSYPRGQVAPGLGVLPLTASHSLLVRTRPAVSGGPDAFGCIAGSHSAPPRRILHAW